MADKKVERSRPDRMINPSQQTHSLLSETGTVNMAEPAHDKGKSALLDKFRRREERWRLEQSLHDREAAASANSGDHRNAGGEAKGAATQGQEQGGEG
jgi:hypothetical protein